MILKVESAIYEKAPSSGMTDKASLILQGDELGLLLMSKANYRRRSAWSQS